MYGRMIQGKEKLNHLNQVRDVGLWKQILKLPVFVDRLDGPIKLLPQGLREELLYWNIEFLRENDSEARIDIILCAVNN